MQSIINTLWTMPTSWRLWRVRPQYLQPQRPQASGIVGGDGIVLGFFLLIAAFVKGAYMGKQKKMGC